MKKKCQWVNSQRQMQSEKSATTMMRRPLETMLLSNNSRFKCSNWSNNIKLNSIEARSTESLQSRARDRQNWLSSRWKESGKSNSINNNWHKDANKRFKSRSMRLRDVRNRLANLNYWCTVRLICKHLKKLIKLLHRVSQSLKMNQHLHQTLLWVLKSKWVMAFLTLKLLDRKLWVSFSKNLSQEFRRTSINLPSLPIINMLKVTMSTITNWSDFLIDNKRKSEKPFSKPKPFTRGISSSLKRKNRWARNSKVPKKNWTNTKRNSTRTKIACSKITILLLRLKIRPSKSSKNKWICRQIEKWPPRRIYSKKPICILI